MEEEKLEGWKETVFERTQSGEKRGTVSPVEQSVGEDYLLSFQPSQEFELYSTSDGKPENCSPRGNVTIDLGLKEEHCE